MRLLKKTGAAIFLATAMSSCSLGGLLGGSAKPPTSLVTLTPEAAEPAEISRSAVPGQAVTILTPTVPKELAAVRVPVQLSPTDIQYVANLQLVDTPDRLFQGLLEETVRRMTSRVVLDPLQSTLDPGLTVTGQLQRFGYDVASRQVVVSYDASLSQSNGKSVQTRRFTASAPADGTAASVGPALNHAANEVALDVAKWIGS